MVPDNFCVFILSHGRADNCKTVYTLQEEGYTGAWYIIIDNEDDQAEKYYQNFGKDHVIMFDKYKKSLEVDTCDIPRPRNAVLYAREVCFETARNLGYRYFLELDDDYSYFTYRYEKGSQLKTLYVTKLDDVINAYLKYFNSIPAKCLAFAQAGDFIGGSNSNVWKAKTKRKVMNCFFCDTEREFHFIGRMNDDVNIYTSGGTRGELYLTVRDISVYQDGTQASAGGLTDMYIEYGTYVKSFFSVIVAPSCVKIGIMGSSHKRVHHLISWENCASKIISDRFKKK
jgi:hypothetical protein